MMPDTAQLSALEGLRQSEQQVQKEAFKIDWAERKILYLPLGFCFRKKIP